MTMFVRTAMAGDVPAIRALVAESFHEAHDSLLGRDAAEAVLSERFSDEALRRRLDLPDSEFVVADDGKAICGMAFASAADVGKTLVLHHLYVRPGMQRRGVGGLLMDEILNGFPDAETCILDVADGNTRAIAFYESFGFAPAGATGDARCHVRMARPLGAAES